MKIFMKFLLTKKIYLNSKILYNIYSSLISLLLFEIDNTCHM